MISFWWAQLLALIAVLLLAMMALNYGMGVPLGEVHGDMLIGLVAGWVMRTLMDLT